MNKLSRSSGKIIIFSTIILSLIGIYLSYSIGGVISENYFSNKNYYLIDQIFGITLGIISALLIVKINYRILLSVRGYIYFILLILLFLTAIFGLETYGSKQWIGIPGFMLKPSVWAIPILIIYIAGYLSSRKQKITTFYSKIVLLTLFSLPAILILLQPNISEAILLFLTGTFLTYLIGNRVLTRTFLLTLAITTFLLLLLSPNYLQSRIFSVINPDIDPYGLGYQTTRSIGALKKGGLTGTTGKLKTLSMPIIPDANTGFILSVIGENNGFIGIEIIVVIYAIFLYGIYITSKIAQNFFGKLLCAGIGFYLTLILIINLGMISGVFPATDITLPFISYTSLTNSVVNYILVGLILSVWSHSPLIDTVYSKEPVAYSYNSFLAKSKKLQLSIESNHIYHWITIFSAIAGLIELIIRILWKK